MPNDTRFCPRCGTPLALEAPHGLCPGCLFKDGGDTTVDERAEVAHSPASPAWVAADGADSGLTVGQAFGAYRILGRLGKGGMGAVYEAEQIDSGRRVALKVLGHSLESPEARKRFLREGRLAASLNHPNSVYIYGTEEIDGMPVIAMELVPGGTLEARIKRDGPLPVGEAVDVVLQIIAGLEAAQNVGVLHRDVKPSNCFVDSDGTVKIGDFGLSIATTVRGDTNLTASGVFLGTPAFSSPEQLRGDELDVRSDIYSVGVTLYYLLTGATPFAGKQMVHLLATVLEQPAPAPVTLRKDVPKGLSRIVQRCLAKRSQARFAGYAELRRALLPYTKTAPTPGTLAVRVAANFIDTFVLVAAACLIALVGSTSLWSWYQEVVSLTSAMPSTKVAFMAPRIACMAGMLLYYGILEGLWGITVGKAVCGLRVFGLDRSVPGIPRALLRGFLFNATAWLPIWTMYALAPVAASTHDTYPIVDVVSVLLFFLMYMTVRRRNGYAAVYDLLSGTRVIRLPTRQVRPNLDVVGPVIVEATTAEHIGPYHVLTTLEVTEESTLVLGYDARLLRRVWIRKTKGGAATSTLPRDLARTGRLRWLGGGGSDEERWDAYEAPTGRSFLSVIAKPQSWHAVRFWLLDLAQELQASTAQATMPELDLDRIWITADGHAKLLDFAAPGMRLLLPDPQAGPAGACLFLRRVAFAALAGAPVRSEEALAWPLPAPLPLPAPALLDRLADPKITELPVAELAVLADKLAGISLAKRCAIVAACWLPLVAFVAFGVLFQASVWQYLEHHPDVLDLSMCLTMYDDPETEGDLRTATATYISAHFAKLIADDDLWSEALAQEVINTEARRRAAAIVATHPSPPATAIQHADAVLHKALPLGRAEALKIGHSYANIAWPVILVVLILAILPSFVCALVFGDSLLLRWLEIAVVTRQGTFAGRGRLLARNALTWAPCLVLVAILVTYGTFLFSGRIGGRMLVMGAVILAFWQLFGAARTLPDRIVRTWLVPR